MKKKLYQVTALIVLGVVIFITVLNLVGALKGLEYKTIDLRFKFRGPRVPSQDIIIVAIDEDSIKSDKLGRFPWPRKVHARLVDKLIQAGAKTVVFDILFTEPDQRDLPSDQQLVYATRQAKNRVIHNAFFTFTEEGEPEIAAPLPGLVKVSKFGFANVFPDLDGVVRHIQPQMDVQGNPMFHLSVEAAANFLDLTPAELMKGVPLDHKGSFILNYAGGFATLPYYAYHEVLSKPVNELTAAFKNKMVVIGTTATGLFDHHPQPFAPFFPGVEIQANCMDNLITQQWIRVTPAILTFVSMIFWGIILALVLPRVSPILCTIAAPVFLVIHFFITHIFFLNRYWLDFISAGLVIVLSYLIVVAYRMLTEEKEKKWIKKSFQSYLSPQVMEEIMSNPSALALGGVRKRLTVMFSDIRNFTGRTESSTPEEIVAVLNNYLTRMTESVFTTGGTLDKFIGDAIMAFWGAPIPQENHAERAVTCALEMVDKLKVFQEEMRQTGKDPIDIGIGINTGDMIVGNMGSTMRMDYTVIGDSVNLSARLEPLNKIYGTHIIIGAETYKDIVNSGKFNLRALGKAKVKGKEIETEIYTVEGWKNPPSA